MIERFQLVRLAVQFGKDADLCPQEFRNHRNGNVVHGSALVSFQPIHVRQVYGGNEDDGGFLKPRMLANQVGQLKTVKIRHTHVHQNDCDIVFQQMFQCLFSRGCFDQILPKLSQYYFITQQLGWLIVDHENVDFFVRSHFCSSMSLALLPNRPGLWARTIGEATYEAQITIALYLPVWPNTRTLLLRDTSRDRLSWLSR